MTTPRFVVTDYYCNLLSLDMGKTRLSPPYFPPQNVVVEYFLMPHSLFESVVSVILPPLLSSGHLSPLPKAFDSLLFFQLPHPRFVSFILKFLRVFRNVRAAPAPSAELASLSSFGPSEAPSPLARIRLEGGSGSIPSSSLLYFSKLVRADDPTLRNASPLSPIY